jgi:hypothetical protein
MPSSRVQIPLGTITINCTIEEIADTYHWLLVEMRDAIPRLRPDERSVLRQIMAQKSKSLTVSDVFPEFTRESEAHKTLRRLRAAQFIRPAVTGRWEPDEHIEVKPFGLLMWRQCGEDLIFGNGHSNNGHAKNHAAESSIEAESPELDLAAPGVNEPDLNESVLLANDAIVESDDDLRDLLSYAKDDNKA